MISRRNFLKIAGLTSVALGAGYTTGKLTGNSNSINYTVHGFIPADEQIISQLVSAFKNKIKSNTNPAVIADSKICEIINRIDLKLRNENFSNNGSITYRLKRLDKQIDSDIIISDGNNSVYSLDDFTSILMNIRSDIKNRKADYFFTAEYSETDFLSSIFKSNKKEVIIENEKGLVDRISLDKNYKNILIDGPQGKTVLMIENGIAQVHKSTCRHEICKHSVAGVVGNIIACAPNKVLVKIELA
ncbi:MAG TPA: NusG domain II-containing protein [Ignavibacteriaceae bacterium]|nr:NusG domain II-containing protein [Ignavibacteriaceae bacterium]